MSRIEDRKVACPIAAVALAVAAMVGCQAPPGDPCQVPPASASDPQAARVLASAQGHHNLDGTWLLGRQAAVLAVDVDVGGGAPLSGSGSGCSASLLLEAQVTVATRDGVLAGAGAVLRFDNPWSAWVEVPLPALPDAYARPDPALPSLLPSWSSLPNERPSAPVPTLILVFSEGGMQANLFVDQARLVGRWSSVATDVPTRQAGPYPVPAELTADCAPAADYTGTSGQYTAFADGAAAASAMVGTWIRCRGFGGPAHAGLQISPDGSWRTLAWRDGGFVTQGGFQQEGGMEPPIDTSDANQPGAFQVNLRGPAVWYGTHLWGDRLIVPDTTAPANIGVSLYVRTSRPVVTAANPFTPGQRAGAAACALPEHGTIDPELGAEMESMLAGEWTLCTGELLDGFVGLRFDGNGAVRLLAADGTSLATRRYRALHPETIPVVSPRHTELLFDDQTDWTIIFSDQPLKLWLRESGPRTTDRQAVFSPLP